MGVAPTPGQVLRVGVPVYDMGCRTQGFAGFLSGDSLARI